MARGRSVRVDEKSLTKGQLRKLNALRKSLGPDIGEKAFSEWYETMGAETTAPQDRNAQLIVDAVADLIHKKGLRIPRGGYLLTRGRGRVIINRAAQA